MEGAPINNLAGFIFSHLDFPAYTDCPGKRLILGRRHRTMDALILVIIAILPPLAFLLYIHHLDSIEPEPHGLILKALLLGALAVIPAAIIELLLGMVPILAMEGLAGAAIRSFIVIAPIEEAVKLGVVLLFIWKNANFNEENDGIVYVGAAAIGFSLLENILYVAQSGFATGIMRAVTSIPLHTFTGVIMGYFVGIAKFRPGARAGNIAAGFVIAYLIHAVYDTFALAGTAIALLIIPLVIALIIFGVIYLKKGARLSSGRWNGTPPSRPEAPAAAEPLAGPAPSKPGAAGSGTYKIVISRVIFALCAGFWALLIAGTLFPGGDEATNPLDVVVGGIILTLVPAAIGLVLELSYRRQKKSQETA
jgi:protease PrsW